MYVLGVCVCEIECKSCLLEKNNSQDALRTWLAGIETRGVYAMREFRSSVFLFAAFEPNFWLLKVSSRAYIPTENFK